jgi:hypothetical protein
LIQTLRGDRHETLVQNFCCVVVNGIGGARGYHGGYGHHHGGGWGNNWVGPVLGAAIVGSAIYAASTPTYAVVAPPVVAVAPPAPRVAYFCGTSQQFYPNVPTCNVPWQLVSY